MTKSTISLTLVTVGLLAIMTASALPLLRFALTWFGYLYAAGAAMLLAGRLLSQPSRKEALRVRRLGRMEIWTALIFVAGAVFIFLPQGAGKDWIAFTLAGGVLTLYTSIMLPREMAKGAKK